MFMMRGRAGARGAHHRGFVSPWGSGGPASAASAARGGRGFALRAAMPLPATPGALPAPGSSTLEYIYIYVRGTFWVHFTYIN